MADAIHVTRRRVLQGALALSLVGPSAEQILISEYIRTVQHLPGITLIPISPGRYGVAWDIDYPISNKHAEETARKKIQHIEGWRHKVAARVS